MSTNKVTPGELQEKLDLAIRRAKEAMRQAQGPRRHNSLDLHESNCGKRCGGCPHFKWVIWKRPLNIHKRPAIFQGQAVYWMTECKAPSRTAAYQGSEEVRMYVDAIVHLLKLRASLMEKRRILKQTMQQVKKQLVSYGG